MTMENVMVDVASDAILVLLDVTPAGELAARPPDCSAPPPASARRSRWSSPVTRRMPHSPRRRVRWALRSCSPRGWAVRTDR
jgi:hypothetical protein